MKKEEDIFIDAGLAMLVKDISNNLNNQMLKLNSDILKINKTPDRVKIRQLIAIQLITIAIVIGLLVKEIFF